MKNWFTALAFALALAASLVLLVFPVYTGFRDGELQRATLIQVNGSGVLLPLSFPVLITLLPLVFRKLPVMVAAAVVMCGFAFISGFSIGMFYMPSAVMALLAACVAPRRARAG